MSAERCPVCDRPDCQRFVRKADGRRITSRMFLDCQMHPVDWRSRALAAERDRDRLTAALLWLEGAERTGHRLVSVFHGAFGELVGHVMATRDGKIMDLERSESAVSVIQRIGRVPIALETIEEFIRKEAAP